MEFKIFSGKNPQQVEKEMQSFKKKNGIQSFDINVGGFADTLVLVMHYHPVASGTIKPESETEE